MDKIRSAISEKVLEFSNSDSYDIKEKLQKINRFRDFVDACQSLIKKYPSIETEFLQMIHSGDFDARIAAMRVDRIIQEQEDGSISHVEKEKIEEDIYQLNQIVENLPIKTEVQTTTVIEQAPLKIEYTDDSSVTNHSQTLTKDNTENDQYVSYIEIPSTPSDDKQAEPLNDTEHDNTTIKKGIYVLGIIACIVILIFIIKFIIAHWQTILLILIGCAIIAGLGWFLLKRKK